ncbi:MAG: HAD-IC family P-type ATPase [Candidatus Freyarchaeum deiterrae]
MEQYSQTFWSVPAADLLQPLQTTPQGLKSEEAEQRLKIYGPNRLKPKKKTTSLSLFLAQFKSPLILILLFAAGLSFFLTDPLDATIILIIIFVSSLLGFWQERGATNAIAKLLAIVMLKATLLRDGSEKEIPFEDIVPGDVVILNAGDGVPGDCLILESKDLFVNEATLTGETYPVEKSVGVLPLDQPLSQRTNTLFMGTNVVSGTAKAVVVNTATKTEFGKVSDRLRFRPPETEFEHGVRRFGYFLIQVTLLLVIAIFVVNIFTFFINNQNQLAANVFALLTNLQSPLSIVFQFYSSTLSTRSQILNFFLFALTLAVGLTPQLLPAIISVNLSHGARRMAKSKVIVKRLSSIENFGSMNVLCSDKTGTLTKGTVQLHSTLDVEGNESEKVLLYAYINSFYETGFANPIDQAICAHHHIDMSGYQKLDEVPYDFIRKRLSILVSKSNTHLMVTKGALENVVEVCSSAETSNGKIVDIKKMKEQIQESFKELSEQGFRTLGVAYRDVGSSSLITKDHEADMTFLGLLVFEDPLKPGITKTLKKLEALGISMKIITGDNRLVATNLSEKIGLPCTRIITGPELRQMSDEALLGQVNDVVVFAEVEPNQKERIIIALRKAGNVVGYIGDGINDASALHASDVSISVESAVDVAKEAADIVLLEKDLNVLVQGVREGRSTFANTIKYVFMAAGSNFGNMFSMAGASLFLTFLPLLPEQILLLNLATDLPEMNIATDNVDPETVNKPRRWDISFIRKFMIVFGPLSSVFDYLTFGVLLLILGASPSEFRTGWFLESIISATLIVLVVRTRRPFYKSRPGKGLLITTIAVIIVSLIIPYTPIGTIFGFEPLPMEFLILMGIIIVIYIASAEIVKRAFYKRIKY